MRVYAFGPTAGWKLCAKKRLSAFTQWMLGSRRAG
jgi:hypothetical protein